MKQFFSLLIAGLIGGAATVGGLKYYEEKNSLIDEANVITTPVAKQVSYAPVNVPFDFTVAASKSLESVVHIKAAESRESAYNRLQQQKEWIHSPIFFSQRARNRVG